MDKTFARVLIEYRYWIGAMAFLVALERGWISLPILQAAAQSLKGLFPVP